MSSLPVGNERSGVGVVSSIPPAKPEVGVGKSPMGSTKFESGVGSAMGLSGSSARELGVASSIPPAKPEVGVASSIDPTGVGSAMGLSGSSAAGLGVGSLVEPSFTLSLSV